MPQSEWDYQQVFNNAQVGLFLTRAADGKIVESNERFAQMLGYENRTQFLTEFVASEHYLEPGARERLLAALRQAGEVNAFDALFSRPDGSTVWLRLSARIYPQDNLIQGVAIDITQQKRTGEALQETNHRLEEMLAKRQREFDAINEIACLANRPADSPSNLSRALEIALRAVGADMGTLSLLDRDAQPSLTVATCTEQDRPALLEMSEVCLAQGLSREAILHQWPVASPDSAAISPLRNKSVHFPYTSLKVKAALAVPLISKGSVIGVMVLLNQESGSFPPSSLAFLDALTTQIAVLIESGHYQSQARALSIMEERQRLARELHDSVAQSLFTLCLAAEGLKATLVDPPYRSERRLTC